MQIRPLIGLWWRRGDQIAALMPHDNSTKSSQVMIDLINALTPVIKKHRPDLNDKGLMDDVADTFKQVLAPPQQEA